MKSMEVQEQFIEMRARGHSFDDISTKLDVSKQTLIKWSGSYNARINNLKSLELDNLEKKYKLSIEKRLESFGMLLGRIQKELNSRDFADISTVKLCELYLKLHGELKKDSISIDFKNESFEGILNKWSI